MMGNATFYKMQVNNHPVYADLIKKNRKSNGHFLTSSLVQWQLHKMMPRITYAVSVGNWPLHFATN